MRSIAAIGLVLLAGCASSNKIRAGANEHQAAAQALEARGDYVGAARERSAAQKQFEKADRRSYEEQTRWWWF
jgi:hypothetical protein